MSQQHLDNLHVTIKACNAEWSGTIICSCFVHLNSVLNKQQINCPQISDLARNGEGSFSVV